jgi:glycosyltransferase involved in cell wall biosynthesis
MNSVQSQRIRVGMIAMTDLDNPGSISGMPHAMAKALNLADIEIIPIHTWDKQKPEPTLPSRALDRVVRIHKSRTPMWYKRLCDQAMPARTHKAVIRRAESLSSHLQTNLDRLIADGEHLDALFGCCISSALYNLSTAIPVVYFSDATLPVLQNAYPNIASRGDSYRNALKNIETESLKKTTAAVFASSTTRRSAINDLGVGPDKTSVVAMGAHIVPEDPNTISSPQDAPTKESCHLIIVAADPIRKRVDLATSATEILHARGINATLHVVGRGTKRSKSSSVVDSVGALKLSDPEDSSRHRELLESCHLQLLPSLGEAFGIAPCESAHFARPSIVSDTGGLPFVVQNGKTGIVLDVDAGAEAWADAVSSLIDQPELYQQMSIQALERARSELNWTSWAQSIRSIILEQIEPSAQGQTYARCI